MEPTRRLAPRRFRDYCAHILIPLNKCRVANYYLPWTCSDLKHAYEKCQYEECALISAPTRADPRARAAIRISWGPLACAQVLQEGYYAEAAKGRRRVGSRSIDVGAVGESRLEVRFMRGAQR